MRILYIATSFPEPDKGATIYTDLAEALHEAGHDITVVVSEQTRNLKKTSIMKERGFVVLRVVTGNYYDVSFIEKGITTFKIPILMKKGISKYLSNNEFDFILYEAPPVTNSKLVSWAKKKYNCRSYLMLKDLFPQNAIDIGIVKKNSLLHKFFLMEEKKLYESADIIGCMSEGNKKYILKHNSEISSDKLELFPNTKKITGKPHINDLIIREKYSIKKDACVFLFGGNMGKPQYVELLCYAIDKCKDDESVFFLFIGRGTERYKLENTINTKNIRNALVIGNLPRDEYEEITKACDIGLIVLDPRFTVPNFPSRILSYMEYSKPILAATDRVTDLKDLIEESDCGEWVWSGDNDAFVEKIISMSQSKSLSDMGRNGRKYIEEHFNINKSVEILEKHFKDVKMKSNF